MAVAFVGFIVTVKARTEENRARALGVILIAPWVTMYVLAMLFGIHR